MITSVRRDIMVSSFTPTKVIKRQSRVVGKLDYFISSWASRTRKVRLKNHFQA